MTKEWIEKGIIAFACLILLVYGVCMIFVPRSFATRLAVIGQWPRIAHIAIGIGVILLAVFMALMNFVLK